MREIYNEEDNRISACKLLFKQHPNLYEFLIHDGNQWLRDAPETLIKNAGVFSSGEKILIHVGLDLCFNASHSSLWDVVNRLDSNNFQNVIKSLIYLRTKGN